MDGWATLEWECCFKNRYDGAREGSNFIRRLIINVTEDSFDTPIKGGSSDADIKSVLAIK